MRILEKHSHFTYSKNKLCGAEVIKCPELHATIEFAKMGSLNAVPPFEVSYHRFNDRTNRYFDSLKLVNYEESGDLVLLTCKGSVVTLELTLEVDFN